MLVRTVDDFVQYLEGKRVPHRAYRSAGLVEIESSAPLPGAVQIRWESSVPFINVRIAVLRDVPEERLKELEAATVRVNDRLPVLGFGLDHANRVQYFRVAVFLPETGVDPDVL